MTKNTKPLEMIVDSNEDWRRNNKSATKKMCEIDKNVKKKRLKYVYGAYVEPIKSTS